MVAKPRGLLITALLILAPMLAYASALPNQFLAWDDSSLVIENPHLQRGAGEALRAFFLSPERFELGGEYLPVRDFSWWVDARLWGKAPSPEDPLQAPYVPAGFILGNIVLHILTTLLVWRWALALGQTPWVSAAAALLFALHPVHTESVTWIASRKDVLSGAFFMGALLAHARWRRDGHSAARFLAIALPSFALAVMSKSTVMALPLVLVLVDVTFFDSSPTRTLKGLLVYVPFLLVAGAFSAIVMHTAASTGLRGHGWHGGSFAANLGLAAAAQLDYLVLLVWPVALRNGYENPEAFTPTPMNLIAVVVIPLLFAAFVTWAVWRWRSPRCPLTLRDGALFFAGWFFLTLLPVSNYLVAMNWLRAERYLYLPSVAFCLLLALALDRLRSRAPAAVPTILLAAISLGYAGRTFARNFDWHDTATVWQTTLARDPASYRAQVELAAWELTVGEPAGIARAVETLRRVAQEHPELPRAHYVLGLALAKQGNLAEGIPQLMAAVAADPDPGVLANLSHALLLGAQALNDHGQTEASAQTLVVARDVQRRRGLRFTDDVERYGTILYNLAVARRKLGQKAEAADALTELLAVPGMPPGIRAAAEKLWHELR
jgi:tetratricopeptide (TPR) repeat protein